MCRRFKSSACAVLSLFSALACALATRTGEPPKLPPELRDMLIRPWRSPELRDKLIRPWRQSRRLAPRCESGREFDGFSTRQLLLVSSRKEDGRDCARRSRCALLRPCVALSQDSNMKSAHSRGENV